MEGTFRGKAIGIASGVLYGLLIQDFAALLRLFLAFSWGASWIYIGMEGESLIEECALNHASVAHLEVCINTGPQTRSQYVAIL